MLPSNSKEQALLAGTGITKAGYLLRRQAGVLKSYFVLLNSHFLTFCCAEDRKQKPVAYLLLTSNTRIFDEDIDASVIRVETGYEVLILKGKTNSEMNEWKRAMKMKVDNLSSLARGHFRVSVKGISKDCFMLLHSECITSHKRGVAGGIEGIIRLYPFNFGVGKTTFEDKGSCICIRSGSTRLIMTARTNIEHQHWVYALNRKQKGYSLPESITTPPLAPLHTGSLELLDLSTMQWSTQYIVLTDNCIYTHDHRKAGTPKKFALTPNSMLYETNLVANRYSFELVLFSECLQLSATTRVERDEWMSMLQALIPKTQYDCTDTLQREALERDVDVVSVSFDSLASPGVCLQARGHWAVASVVAEPLTSTVCPGSILSSIEGVNVTLADFDNVAESLCLCNAPLHLSFWHSPRKMGWLQLVNSKRSSSRFWSKRAGLSESERVYGTLSSGKLCLYVVKRQGKSTKSILQLRGASIGLVGNNCFKVNSGLEVVKLQAVSSEDALNWATSIAHSISMENGGGVLLEKEKMKCDASSLSDWESPPADEAKEQLCDAHETSRRMEKAADSLKLKEEVNQQWLEIDRASSVTSDEEKNIVDMYSDIDNFNHVNAEDYIKLVHALGGGGAN